MVHVPGPAIAVAPSLLPLSRDALQSDESQSLDLSAVARREVRRSPRQRVDLPLRPLSSTMAAQRAILLLECYERASREEKTKVRHSS